MSVENLSRIAEHERHGRRQSAIVGALVAAAFVVVVLGVIAVLTWR